MLNHTLKELRKKKGITQEQLADILGVERSSVGKYESPSKPVIPSADVLSRMADYFDVSLDYLFGRDSRFNEKIEKEPPALREVLEGQGINDEEFLDKLQYIVDLKIKAENNAEIASELSEEGYNIKYGR